MANEYVSDGFKDRLRVAARAGRNDGQCHVSLNIQRDLNKKGIINNTVHIYHICM